jgi:hypothetical protein
MKTELEEAAESFAKTQVVRGQNLPEWDDKVEEIIARIFTEGAKYMAERSYSEEDMKQFAWECVANFLSNNVNEVEMALVEVIIDRNNKQFEQFKKK